MRISFYNHLREDNNVEMREEELLNHAVEI
jgi:hypothetical protein